MSRLRIVAIIAGVLRALDRHRVQGRAHEAHDSGMCGGRVSVLPVPLGMTAPLPPLCGPCAAESERWLDTSPSTLLPRLSFTYGSGAAYDASPAGTAERRRSRHAEWAATVRFQRALIAAGCRIGVHADRSGDLAA